MSSPLVREGDSDLTYSFSLGMYVPSPHQALGNCPSLSPVPALASNPTGGP